MSFMDDLEDLETAEDFLRYFEVAFDQKVVHVNRLHILQRFHDYLRKDATVEDLGDDDKKAAYKAHLLHAYNDFVESNAIRKRCSRSTRKRPRRWKTASCRWTA